MSRAADIRKILPQMLEKYPESNHKAIVEVYADMLEDGWDDGDLSEFLDGGKGISPSADLEIYNQKRFFGIQ